MKPSPLNKLIESFNKLNEQVRYCLLVGVVFLIVLLDVFFLIMPQMASIFTVNDQVKKMSDDTAQVLTERTSIVRQKQNLQKTRVELSSLANRVRSLQEVPAILSTISGIANEYDVKIDQLVPQKTQQEVLATAPEGKYYSLPVIIKARCGYHQFGRFLSKLETQDLYFFLKDFIIQNDEKSADTHLFSLTINMVLVDKTPGQSKSL